MFNSVGNISPAWLAHPHAIGVPGKEFSTYVAEKEIYNLEGKIIFKQGKPKPEPPCVQRTLMMISK